LDPAGGFVANNPFGRTPQFAPSTHVAGAPVSVLTCVLEATPGDPAGLAPALHRPWVRGAPLGELPTPPPTHRQRDSCPSDGRSASCFSTRSAMESDAAGSSEPVSQGTQNQFKLVALPTLIGELPKPTTTHLESSTPRLGPMTRPLICRKLDAELRIRVRLLPWVSCAARHWTDAE
jgi:hypothetical protein